MYTMAVVGGGRIAGNLVAGPIARRSLSGVFGYTAILTALVAGLVLLAFVEADREEVPVASGESTGETRAAKMANVAGEENCRSRARRGIGVTARIRSNHGPVFPGQAPREPELMDAPSADPATLRQSLNFIRRINRWLGYTRSTLHHLRRFSRSWKKASASGSLTWPPARPIFPRAILRWSRRAGFDVRIVAIDRHAVTVHLAAEGKHDPALTVLQADVFHLPFAPASFDYVITAMFLHHLDEDKIVTVLQTMDRLARRGILVADLLRRRRAYLWIKLFTLFSNPMVKHDAAVSVAQALSHS